MEKGRGCNNPPLSAFHPDSTFYTPPPVCPTVIKHLIFRLGLHQAASSDLLWFPPLPINQSKVGKGKMRYTATLVIVFQLFILQISILPAAYSLPCRSFCGTIPVKYPFGVDEGCGAPQYKGMLNCSSDLFFLTPSGNYKVQSIDYDKKTMVVYDPAMSTCSILQPHHDFVMSDIQSAIIPPSSDTVFALLNCSIDSPVLNHYKSLCFNFSGHTCDELYGACTSFKLFHLLSNSSPPCCFTGYDTVKYMSMNILDCTHYTSVYNTDGLKGIVPLDWSYGIKLSYAVPETGCDRCAKSGGTCGFDTETGGTLCICSSSANSTRECAGGSMANMEGNQSPLNRLTGAFLMVLAAAVAVAL